FLVMAIVQTLHYSEHVIEVIQYHFFNTPAKDSLALFSRLNVEGVHFGGDTFLTVGTLALLYKFPRNPWLWVALPFQIAHQAEQEVVIDTLGHGKVFGEHGVLVPGAVHDKTVRAKTELSVLAMDEPTLQHLMNASVTPQAPPAPTTPAAPTAAPAS